MRDILVLGGTRFFGKKLVQRLIDNGDRVVIATRGNVQDEFGAKVQRVVMDRKNKEDLERVASMKQWDIVYDNICFTPNDAKIACEAFGSNVQRYILTSTLAVYEADGTFHSEGDFDPHQYAIDFEKSEELPYGEGKRASEAVFYQQSALPSVTAVRFPIVLGEDDYTKRLHFHVDRISSQQPLGVPNLEASLSFITSDEAADFLFWLSNHQVDGPVNACSNGFISLDGIVATIESATGQNAKLEETAAKSPFGVSDSWVMSPAKAQAAGFSFKALDAWFPELVDALVKTS